MGSHSLSLAMDPDRSAIRLTINGDDQALFTARLEAPELDELIHALAKGRAHLAEEVAPTLDEGARLTDVEADPGYLVGKNRERDEALIALRHPGFGWLGFRLRRPVIEEMLDRLGRWLHEAA
jgi:hypothetical protein